MDNAVHGTGASESVAVVERAGVVVKRPAMTPASGVAKVSRQRKTGGTVGRRIGEARALRLLRISRGLTLADAGLLCGLSQKSVMALELGGPTGKKTRTALRELLRQLRKMPALAVRGDEGSALRTARHRAGLSQTALQSLTGVSYAMLSRVESGERRLTDVSRARLYAEIGFETREGLHTLPVSERGETGRFIDVEIMVGEEPEDLARGVA